MHTSKLATLARAALAAAVLLLLSLTTHAQTLYYLHADHLNTPRLLTDQNQAVVWRWDQTEPFGDSMGVGSMGRDGFVVTVPLRFPRQYFDKETNLHYNYQRDAYDSAIGRYTQFDPIGLSGGINGYNYVHGNPIWSRDPLGLFTEITVWNAVGIGESSFGHVSANINGANYSLGPGGWDTRYPRADDY